MNVFRRNFGKLVQELTALEAQVADEQDSARKELDRLLRLPQAERLAALRHPSLCLVDLLLDESRAAFMATPDRSWELSTLALEICERLSDDGRMRPRLVQDAALLALAHRANVLRIRREFDAADELLATVVRQVSESSGQASLVAEIFFLLTSLRLDQNRFPEAAACATRAATLYREIGDDENLALALVKVAIIENRRNRSAPALAALAEAEALKTADGSELADLLYLTVYHNRAVIHIDDGDYASARAAMTPRLLALYETMGERTALLGTWMHGRALASAPVADPSERDAVRDEALRILWAVRDAQVRAGDITKLVLVSLDLAIVYSDLGETEALLSVLDELEPFLTAQNLHTEILASLLLVRDAVRKDVLTAELARQWRAHVERFGAT